MNYIQCEHVLKTTVSRMRTCRHCQQSITNENYKMTSYHERPKRRFYLVCQICRRYLVGKTTVYRCIRVTQRERRSRRRVSRLKHALTREISLLYVTHQHVTKTTRGEHNT